MVIVVGPYCYGAGVTLQQAVNRAKYGYGGPAPMPYNAYEATSDWSVDHCGTISATKVRRVREVRVVDGRKVVRTGANILND